MVEEWHSFMAFNESSCGPFKNSYHMGHREYVAFDKQKGEMEDVSPLDGVTLPLLWKDDPAQPMVETISEDAGWFPHAYIIGGSLP
ncbi:hypothetical protein RHMOL_Rhmol03G0135800 [Rhododendron molle]|uniref:Uncharacterized protein n=1 Tax=Rhododendron molle TaxID=49168 RepID=A0ACC0PFD9_RHOML|nr:hypothetical protein RHMOL_Rhmol03G0135800 [Rhododendron molle]